MALRPRITYVIQIKGLDGVIRLSGDCWEVLEGWKYLREKKEKREKERVMINI